MFEAIGEGHKIMHEGVTKEIDLDELERLAKAATPGPWQVVDKGSHFYVTDSNPNREIAKITRIPKAVAENAAYIVASCNAVPELIAAHRELLQKVQQLERQRDWLATFIEDNMDCEQCPYYETICKPQAPVDCAKFISQKAKEAGE